MQIKTQRLTLEPLGTKFLVSTHAYASDPELTRLMVFLPTDDLAETERYLKKCEAEAAKERPQFYEMAVLLDGRHIGSVSAYLEENGTGAGLDNLPGCSRLRLCRRGGARPDGILP